MSITTVSLFLEDPNSSRMVKYDFLGSKSSGMVATQRIPMALIVQSLDLVYLILVLFTEIVTRTCPLACVVLPPSVNLNVKGLMIPFDPTNNYLFPIMAPFLDG